MQITKTKGVTTLKLTRFELRQLRGAEEIMDMVRALGGDSEDISELIENDGVVVLGGAAAPPSLFDHGGEGGTLLPDPLDEVADSVECDEPSEAARVVKPDAKVKTKSAS